MKTFTDHLSSGGVLFALIATFIGTLDGNMWCAAGFAALVVHYIAEGKKLPKEPFKPFSQR